MAADTLPIPGGRPEPPSSSSSSGPSQAMAAPAAVAVSGARSATAVPTDEALDEVRLDASKLHCYQVALELHTQCSVLVAVVQRVVRDQLERASLSVLLNTAEAAGRHSHRQKAYYYGVARGSATEVAALLDVLERRRLASPAAVRTARRLAIRCIQMLTRVHQRLRPS